MGVRRCLPTYQGCVVCGLPSVNPAALKVRWFVAETGNVETELEMTERQAGYKGIIHGGIIGSLLDEGLGWAAAVHDERCYVTGRLSVEYKNPIKVGTRIQVWGKYKKGNELFALAEGAVTDANGTIYARAEGTFFAIPHEESIKVLETLYFDPAYPDRLDPSVWFGLAPRM